MKGCAFYVEDSVGDKFLYTISDASYEAKFRDHAQWWKRHVRSPSGRKDRQGRPIRTPVFPVRIVVEQLE